MNQPEPQALSFSTLISDIEKGTIKLPQFQRDFVWTKQKSAKLLDSIVKGYPIGTFILWKTKEKLRSIRNLGSAQLPDTPEGDFIQYILDGQQRLTSLYASIKGLKIKRDGRTDDYSEIFIDLSANEDSNVVVTDISESENDKNRLIKVTDLLNKGIKFFSKYPAELHDKIDDYKLRIKSCSFSAILLKEVSLDSATEIFTRINVTGNPLSVFEIMVAKTFDAGKEFDLSEKYNELIERLKEVDYESISNITVLQTVSVLLSKECSKKQLLKLDKKKFIEIWDDTVDAIERTVDYFRSVYRIPVSKLLPYNALIIPFAYFFYRHPDKPTGDSQRYLQDFFWRCSLSARYSSALESKIAQDIKRIDIIIKDRSPKYDYPVDVNPDFIKNNGWFSAGRSFIKAILCIFCYHQPKSFIDDSLVQISNDWLKQANSRNYHHFFPKAYLKKEGKDESVINHIVNICLVDDFLNKRVIHSQKPSKYMKSFQKQNKNLNSTMKSHLIDLDKFKVWNDNYDIFFDKRAKAISNELKERIIPQDIDKKGLIENINDYDESDT